MSSQRSQSASKDRKTTKNDTKETRDCEKELEQKNKKCVPGSKYEPNTMLENRAQTIQEITKNMSNGSPKSETITQLRNYAIR